MLIFYKDTLHILTLSLSLNNKYSSFHIAHEHVLGQDLYSGVKIFVLVALAIFVTDYYRGHLCLTSTSQGRFQGFWLGGSGFFFSKAWGLGAAFRPQVGPGQRPGRGQRATPPEAPEYKLVILGVKFNHIISPYR